MSCIEDLSTADICKKITTHGPYMKNRDNKQEYMDDIALKYFGRVHITPFIVFPKD